MVDTLWNKTNKKKLHFKGGAIQFYRLKCSFLFGTVDAINNKLIRLESLGVISPADHSEWAAPVVFVKKADNKIQVTSQQD